MLHEQLDSRLADPGLPHRVVRCHWSAITDSPTLSSQHERVARGASCQPAPSDRVDLEWNTRLKPALIDADWKSTLTNRTDRRCVATPQAPLAGARWSSV